jgi:hypothetical protein
VHHECQRKSRIHREIRERNRALAHGAHYDRFMRWVIACALLAQGCRSAHVSELPLVHDIRPAPAGLVVDACALQLEHAKDYTLWPLMLFADMVIIFVPNGQPVGLSIESFAITDARCRTQVVSTQ